MRTLDGIRLGTFRPNPQANIVKRPSVPCRESEPEGAQACLADSVSEVVCRFWWYGSVKRDHRDQTQSPRHSRLSQGCYDWLFSPFWDAVML